MSKFLEESSQRVELIENDFDRLEKEYEEFLQKWNEETKSCELQFNLFYNNS